MGLSTQRSAVALPSIDRRALMHNTHRIARHARPHMASSDLASASPMATPRWAESVSRVVFDYAAIGTVVNLAGCLCEEARDGEILVDAKVHASVDGELPGVLTCSNRHQGRVEKRHAL
jgi:hypothetical protein